MNNVLLYIVTALFILVPLVFWHGVFFPYTFIKTIVFYVLVEIALLVWLLDSWRKENSKGFGFLHITPFHIAYAGFLIVVGISAFAGVDAVKSVWSDWERMFGLITWLHFAVFFVVTLSVLNSERSRNIMVKSIMGTGLFVSLSAVFQGLTTADLAIATIGNAAYLSSYLIPVFFLTLLFLLQQERFSFHSVSYIAILLVILAAVVFTEARAGIVGLGAGIGVVFLCFLFWGDKKGLKQIFAVLLMLGIGIGVLLVFTPEVVQPVIPDRLASLLDFNVQGRTASARVLVWRAAWEGWKEQFLFGWGSENFNILFNTYYDPALYIVEPWFDRAHNIVFDVGGTLGIAGLLLYGALFGSAAYMAIRQWKKGYTSFWTMAVIVALLTAHVAQNMFTFDTISPFLVITFVFGSIAARERNVVVVPETLGEVPGKSLAPRLAGGEPTRFESEARRGTFFRYFPLDSLYSRWGLGLFAMAMMGFVCYAVVVKPYLANAAAHRGWELLRTGGGDEEAIREFEKSLSYGTAYSVDARRFQAEYVFEFLKRGGNRPDSSLRRLTEYAIEKMDENIRSEPHNVKWVMYRGELYSLMAQKFDGWYAQKAEQDFLRAKELSPGRPQIYFELAEARKRQGDIQEAWNYLDSILRVVPEFPFAHLNAVVLAVETGDRAREEVEMAWLTERDEFGSPALRDAYYKQGRYQEAVRVQEKIIQGINPPDYTIDQYAVYYAHLAALYQKAGEIEKAREAALKVLQINPRQKNEVEAFLKMLK